MRLASLTGLFGTNSSGKTAILQLLLMLKQTVESADRSRVLHTGDERSYVDLGTPFDVIYRHELPGSITFGLAWTPPKSLRIADPEAAASKTLFTIDELSFEATVHATSDSVAIGEFSYSFSSGGVARKFGMERKDTNGEKGGQTGYDLSVDGYSLKRARGRMWPLPPPVKTYGFPDQVNAYYQNVGFLSELVLAFEQLFHNIFYLGPLREYPHRSYVWAGEQPQDVGRRGELAVPALLAARTRGATIGRGHGRRRQMVDERVAEWLRDLGLIFAFELRSIAENRKEYEVRVQRSRGAPWVLITDVGFGVSQILPVLVLCYYAPEGATLLFEQPEIHLHPSVQAGLADVFIDAIGTRKVQIVLESHSEHLLRRLQRRVAEDGIDAQRAALYFVSETDGKSHLEPLQMDLYGSILNWPDNFFGDEMGDLVAMTEAEMRRRGSAQEPAAQ